MYPETESSVTGTQQMSSTLFVRGISKSSKWANRNAISRNTLHRAHKPYPSCPKCAETEELHRLNSWRRANADRLRHCLQSPPVLHRLSSKTQYTNSDSSMCSRVKNKRPVFEREMLWAWNNVKYSRQIPSLSILLCAETASIRYVPQLKLLKSA